VRREVAGAGVSVSAVLPSAVRTELVSGIPLGRGLPTVRPETIAREVVQSCATRRAEIAVPGYIGKWDVVEALVPESVLGFARSLIGERRALTSVDSVARRGYAERVARQAASR
jgi:short-subunit dehydrogenase